MMPQRRVVFAVLAGLFLAACQGPMSPEDPAGADGQPGTRLNYVVPIAANGHAEQTLPAVVGTDPSKPPAVTCYVSKTGTNWELVSQDLSAEAPWCHISFYDGVWDVYLDFANDWAYAAFVVTY